MLFSVLIASLAAGTQPLGCGPAAYLGEISSEPTDLHVIGDLVYTLERSNGLVITDTAMDPLNPIARFKTDPEAFGIMISGDVGVLTRSNSRPVLLDLSHPLIPVQASEIPESLGSDWDDIYLDAHTLLANPDSRTINLYDVDNPYAPRKVASITAEADDHLQGYTINDGHLYAVRRQGQSRQLIIFNISNPSLPVLVSSIEIATTSVAIRDLVVKDGLLIATVAGNHPILAFDVSDPSAPRRLSIPKDLRNAGATAVAPGGITAVVFQGGFLHVLNRGDDTALLATSAMEWNFGESRPMFNDSSDFFIATTPTGTMSIDITDPAKPRIEWLRPSISAGDVKAIGSTLIATTRLGTIVIDARNPDSMKIAGTAPRLIPNERPRLIVDRPRSIAFEIGHRIIAVDISNPNSPQELSSIVGLDGLYAYTASQTTLFLSGFGPLRHTPAIVTSDIDGIFDDESISPNYNGWEPDFLHAGNGFLYAQARDLLVFDLSSLPDTPRIGTFDLSPSEQIIAINGGFVYTNESGTLHIIDTTDLQNIKRVDYQQTAGFTSHQSVVVSGDKLFFLGNTSFLYVFDITQKDIPRLVTTIDFEDTLGDTDLSITGLDIQEQNLYAMVSAGAFSNRSPALVSIQLPECAVPCPADLAIPDGTLDVLDIAEFIRLYLDRQVRADFNRDGVFNFFDVALLMHQVSEGCPSNSD